MFEVRRRMFAMTLTNKAKVEAPVVDHLRSFGADHMHI